MYVITKEIAYTVTAETEKEAEQVAKNVQSELYEKHDIVDRYPNGRTSYRVIAQARNDILKD